MAFTTSSAASLVSASFSKLRKIDLAKPTRSLSYMFVRTWGLHSFFRAPSLSPIRKLTITTTHDPYQIIRFCGGHGQNHCKFIGFRPLPPPNPVI